jgi:hypothetical protein
MTTIKFSKTHRAVVFVFLALVLAGIACNMPGQTTPEPAAPVEVEESESEMDQPMEVMASATPVPAATETPLPTDTSEPTFTPSATPTSGPDFSNASVYGVSHMEKDRILISVEVPGGVEGTYQASVGMVVLTCEILSEYPDRLYCSGPEPFENYQPINATIMILAMPGGSVVYESEFSLPARPTPTPTPSPEPSPTP